MYEQFSEMTIDFRPKNHTIHILFVHIFFFTTFQRTFTTNLAAGYLSPSLCSFLQFPYFHTYSSFYQFFTEFPLLRNNRLLGSIVFYDQNMYPTYYCTT